MKRTRFIPNSRWSAALLLGTAIYLSCTSMVMAAEPGARSGLQKETMFSLLKKGGPVMIPIGIASIIAMALGIERHISLSRNRILPDGFLKGLATAWDEDPTGLKAEQYCDESKGAAGHVFKAGIQWRNEGYQAVSKAIEDAGAREADKITRSLRPLPVIASVCPLLGLLGSVFGMIESFQATAQSSGAAKMGDLANGIFEALIATAAGLTVAIPVVILFHWLASRADRAIDHIDEVGTEFILKHARLTAPTPIKS